MAQLYRKYMRLLNKWPVDKTRTEDLGLYIREQIKIEFTRGENSKIQNQELCEKKYESLDKIASNYYSTKYPHNFKKSATGLNPELCSLALSDEGQKVLQGSKGGFFAKVKRSVKRIVSKDQEYQ